MTDDESGESMEPMEEVPLIGLAESEMEIIIAWMTDRSRELIPETRRSILEGNADAVICYWLGVSKKHPACKKY